MNTRRPRTLVSLFMFFSLVLMGAEPQLDKLQIAQPDTEAESSESVLFERVPVLEVLQASDTGLGVLDHFAEQESECTKRDLC